MPKKKKNGRAKGARGELAVAKILAKWWGEDMTRTPASGGFRTPKFRQEWNAEGDIVCPDESFPFVVEVKWQEGWTLDSLIVGTKSSPIWKWWQQAKRQQGHRIPLLVYKRNNHPWLYMIPKQKGLTMPGRTLTTTDHEGETVLVGLIKDLCRMDPNNWD